MELRDVLRRRRMVRNYQDRAVPREVLDRVLAAGVRAPSAGFTQGFAFLVLEGRDETERFWGTTWTDTEARARFRWQGLFRAPVIVVPLASKQAYLDRYAEPDKGRTDRSEDAWGVPYWYVDTAFATMLLLLAAVDEGLGGLFFRVFVDDVQSFRDAFGIPVEYTPIGAITLGWPAPDEPSPSLRRGRRAMEEVVHRGRWRG